MFWPRYEKERQHKQHLETSDLWFYPHSVDHGMSAFGLTPLLGLPIITYGCIHGDTQLGAFPLLTVFGYWPHHLWSLPSVPLAGRWNIPEFVLLGPISGHTVVCLAQDTIRHHGVPGPCTVVRLILSLPLMYSASPDVAVVPPPLWAMVNLHSLPPGLKSRLPKRKMATYNSSSM